MIVFVDYGIGNLTSIANAFRKLGIEANVSSDTKTIATADGALLPGAGNFCNLHEPVCASGLKRRWRRSRSSTKADHGSLLIVFAPSRMNQAILGAGILAVIWVAFFALAHAITNIDFDWRYRLPVYAPLGVLAIIGFSYVRSALVRLVLRPDAA